MSNEPQSAYPLCWPMGWPRHAGRREEGIFKGTFDQIRRELCDEIDALVLGAQARTHRLASGSVVISTNIPLRRDGFPSASASARAPEDPGVAVYFTRKKQNVCFACDKYDAVWKNLRAIQRTIEALRGIDRWASAQILDRAFTGFAALPDRTGQSPWDLLGVSQQASEADIMEAWRTKAKAAHPDVVGGSEDAMRELNAAKDLALSTLRARR